MLHRLRARCLKALMCLLLAGLALGCTPHGAIQECVRFRPSHCTTDGPCRLELELRPDHTATFERSSDVFDAVWAQGRTRSGQASLTVHVPELGDPWSYELDLQARTLTSEDDWVFDPGPCSTSARSSGRGPS